MCSAPHVLLPLYAQPEPLMWAATYIEGPDGGRTVIARFWEPGDAARCRLCPLGRCTVTRGGLCQVTYRGHVSAVAAPLYTASNSA